MDLQPIISPQKKYESKLNEFTNDSLDETNLKFFVTHFRWGSLPDHYTVDQNEFR